MATCKYCDRTIYWGQMPAGNYLPLDPGGGIHECVPFAAGSPDGGAQWNVFDDRSHLTFSTTCWWCGEPVFFYRDENGGCALFDELGAPWKVHRCWEEYRTARRAAASHFSRRLTELGYTGRHYPCKLQVRRTPAGANLLVDVYGFIADNKGQSEKLVLQAATGASTSPVAELWVAHGDSEALPFLFPWFKAAHVANFRLVRAVGMWVPFGSSAWLLVPERLELLRSDGSVADTIQLAQLPAPVACRYCRQEIKEASTWGFDPDGRIECKSCSEQRGQSSPAKFDGVGLRPSQREPHE